MSAIFLWENAHFAIHMFAFLAFLAAWWLHVDAWMGHKRIRAGIGVLGWAGLAGAFLVEATDIQAEFLVESVFSSAVYMYGVPGLRLCGYLAIAVSVWTEPLQKHPEHHTNERKAANHKDARGQSGSDRAHESNTAMSDKPMEQAQPGQDADDSVDATSPAGKESEGVPSPAKISHDAGGAKATAANQSGSGGGSAAKKPTLLRRVVRTVFGWLPWVGKNTRARPAQEEKGEAQSEPDAQTSSRTPGDVSASGDDASQTDDDSEGPVVASYMVPLGLPSWSVAVFPIAALGIALGYLRRGVWGLERHVRPMALVFTGFALFEVAAFARVWLDTSNPTLYNFASVFGPLWIGAQVLLAISCIGLLWWVGKYLLRRLKTQLLLTFLTITLLSFVAVAVTFGSLLIRNMESAMLHRLNADAKTLQLLLDNRRDEITSDAQVLANNDQLIEALAADEPDGDVLSGLARDFLINKKEDTLIITDEAGAVLARGESPGRAGGAISDNPLVSAAREGTTDAASVVKQGALAQVISVRAAVPVLQDGNVIGVVLAGAELNTPFVDGIERATGINAAVFAERTLSASTFTADEEGARYVGSKLDDERAARVLFEEGRGFSGASELLGTTYLASYEPIVGRDGQVIGALFVGTPELDALRATARSLQLTFIAAAALMALSVAPSFLIARRISRQVK